MDLLIKLITGLKPEPKDLKTFMMFVALFILLRDEIRENKIRDEADKKVIEFRLNALERKNPLAFNYKEKFAILADKPERKDYE
jgi:hypothetical protein